MGTEALERLKIVRRHGNKMMARCPAHDDRTASLSVKVTDDGRVLLYCHAGCPYQEVLRAMGMEQEQNPREGQTPDAVYPYQDARGTTIYEVCRFPGKRFAIRLPGGKWGLDGRARVLYHLPDVLRAVQAERWVWVCEGEKDADNLRRLKNVCATTITGGVRPWSNAEVETLRGAKVVICMDFDHAGVPAALDLAERLKSVAAQVVLSAPVAPHKDVTESGGEVVRLEDRLLDVADQIIDKTMAVSQRLKRREPDALRAAAGFVGALRDLG